MKKAFQRFLQIVFIALFIFLIKIGKIQLWMGIFLVSIIASFLLGRIYCGWICPINTVMKAITWIKKKLHIPNLRLPKSLNKPFIRYIILGLFLLTFIIIMITGRRLPVLPGLFVLGIILTFFFPEELWHYCLCPYGTMLRYPAAKAKHYLAIDADKCNNCGACKRVCPTKAIEKKEKHRIIKNECLICLDCSRSCRLQAIHYK